MAARRLLLALRWLSWGITVVGALAPIPYARIVDVSIYTPGERGGAKIDRYTLTYLQALLGGHESGEWVVLAWIAGAALLAAWSQLERRHRSIWVTGLRSAALVALLGLLALRHLEIFRFGSRHELIGSRLIDGGALGFAVLSVGMALCGRRRS